MNQIFYTIGSRSLHKHEQYNFAIEDAEITWFHRDHLGQEIFRIKTLAVVQPRKWVNIIATYDNQEERARVFLDGELVKEDSGSGYLSQDWGHFAGFGRDYYKNKYFSGALDEVTVFNYALPDDEVKYVSKGECNSDR